MRLRSLFLFLCVSISCTVEAADLESLFSGVATCHFDKFYYDEPDRNLPHSYFIERALKPYKEADGLYYFLVNEQVFGLPAVELVVPGTQDLHAVIFDTPLTIARKALSARFGSDFRESAKSRNGEAPVLVSDVKNVKRSILYCVESSESAPEQ